MKRHRLSLHKAIGITGASVVLWLAASGVAEAWALHWGTRVVQTSSGKKCISFASDAMRGLSMHDIRASGNSVSGNGPGIVATIVCIGTNPVTAVVMVASDSDTVGSNLLNRLEQKVVAIRSFD